MNSVCCRSETAPGVGSPLAAVGVTAVVDMVMLYSPTRARPAGSASRTRTMYTGNSVINATLHPNLLSSFNFARGCAEVIELHSCFE